MDEWLHIETDVFCGNDIKVIMHGSSTWRLIDGVLKSIRFFMILVENVPTILLNFSFLSPKVFEVLIQKH